jgi:hypothetical protein
MVDAETITMDSFQRKYGLPAREAEDSAAGSRPATVQQQYSFVHKRSDGPARRGPTRLEIRAEEENQPAASRESSRPNETKHNAGAQVNLVLGDTKKEGEIAKIKKKDMRKEEDMEEDYSKKPLPDSPPLLPSPAKTAAAGSTSVRVGGDGESVCGGRDQPVIESAVIATSEDEEQLLPPPGIRRVPRPPVRRRPKSTPASGMGRSRSSPGGGQQGAIKDSSSRQVVFV